MAEYHVGSGLFAIYAGVLNKEHTEWKDKTACTDEAIEAVRDYMVTECLGGFDCFKAHSGGYEWKLKDGRKIKLIVAMKEPPEKREGDSSDDT